MTARRNLSFEEFIEFQFGPAVRTHGNPWYFDLDADWWEPEPRTGIAYLTRLFTNGPAALRWFSDGQIAQGLTGLINTMAIGDQPWMRDPVTPAEERAAVWTAVADLFEQLLGPRCAPTLGHLTTEPGPPLNTVAYMWWESFPGLADSNDPQRALIDDAELACLERILMLKWIACQEAALHGLGHGVGRDPRCAEVINRYLAGDPPPELADYAKAARNGCIQ